MFRSDKGQVLAMVLLLTAGLVLLGGTALALGTTVGRNAALEIDQKQAYYVCEAGVERALALAMRGCEESGLWLDSLEPGVKVDLDSLEGPYPAGGTGLIESVCLTRGMIGADGNVIPVSIVSVGRHGQSRRRLTVEAELYLPVDFRNGIWFEDPSTYFGAGSELNAPVTAVGDFFLDQSLKLGGLLRCGGNLLIGDGAVISSLPGEELSCRVNGDIVVGQNSRLEGVVEHCQNLMVGMGGIVENSIDSRRNQDINGKVYPDNILENALNGTVPGLPGPAPERLRDVARLGFEPEADLMHLAGVYFVKGDLNLSGTYQGTGTVAAAGRICINGDLEPADPDSSLALIAFGNQTGDGHGIEVGANAGVSALLFSPVSIGLGDGAAVYGSLVSPKIEVNTLATVRVTYDETLVSRWIEASGRFSRIASWKEM